MRCPDGGYQLSDHNGDVFAPGLRSVSWEIPRNTNATSAGLSFEDHVNVVGTTKKAGDQSNPFDAPRLAPCLKGAPYLAHQLHDDLLTHLIVLFELEDMSRRSIDCFGMLSADAEKCRDDEQPDPLHDSGRVRGVAVYVMAPGASGACVAPTFPSDTYGKRVNVEKILSQLHI